MRRSPIALIVATIVVVAAAGTAIAATAVDVQANQPQVAGDASSNTTALFPTNKQNEPTIAVAPDGVHAIGGANDEQKEPKCGPGPQRGATAPGSDCSFFPNVGTSGVYTSSDGGTTWLNRGVLPGYADTGAAVATSAGALATSAPAGSLVSDGDPVIAFGPEQGTNGAFSWTNGTRAYYANLSSFSSAGQQGNQLAEVIGVSISDTYGASWFDPVVAATSHGNVFNDKESIWADRNPNSPFFGRVYLSYSEFRSVAETAEPIIVVFSTDGGLTWSKQNQVSSAFNNRNRGGRQGSVIRTGPDGTVYVVFEDSDNKLGSQQVVVVSHDGGVTFSKKISIAQVTDLPAAIPGSNFRTDSFPSVGVNPSTGTIYVTWVDATAAGGRVKVARSTNGGQTWSAPATVSSSEGYAFYQGLDVAPNGRIDVGYQALVATNPATYGTGNARIDSYYVSSTNGGATWSSPVKISTASSDPAASAQNNLQLQFWGDYNTLASTSTTALFIYTDSRNGVGCSAVDAYQHGLDGTGPSVPKPAPGTVCPAQFGNSDIYVSVVTP